MTFSCTLSIWALSTAGSVSYSQYFKILYCEYCHTLEWRNNLPFRLISANPPISMYEFLWPLAFDIGGSFGPCSMMRSRSTRIHRQVLRVVRYSNSYTEAPSTWGKSQWFFHVLPVFGLFVLRDQYRTRSIWRFCTANTAILAAFWGSIVWNTPVQKVLTSGMLSVLGSI